jgi:trigger factor
LSSPETNTEVTTPEANTDVSQDTHQHDHTDSNDHAHGPEMNPECKREVSVEIPTDVVEAEEAKVLKKYQRLANIPGFRKGKVPPSIIRNRFNTDIRGEVVENLLPRYFREAVEKEKLMPVSQPQIADMHFHPGEPLRFKAIFEVLPEITVSGYQELSAEKKDITVTDADVDEALKTIQYRQASFEPVDDRPLQDGDYAQVSFTGQAKAAPAGAESTESPEPATHQKPVNVDDVMVEIGGPNTVKDFSENLRGATPGEERVFDVTYPEDFSDQRLAGQMMNYRVKVHGVKKRVVPELNDDLAKELGDFQSLDDLRQRLRENIEAERKHEVEHAAKDKLIEELVSRNQFPVPQALVDRQIEARLERGFRALAAQGMKSDDMRKMNFSRLREAQKDAAIREVRASLLLDKIADTENIDATEEDINREIELLSLQTKQPAEVLRKRLTEDGSLDRIRDRIRNEKALEFLYTRSA